MNRDILFGIVLAGLTSLVLMALPEPLAKGLVSILLSVIAAIYIGFSLSSKGKLPYLKQIGIDLDFMKF
jgi:uncharacterized protein YacL